MSTKRIPSRIVLALAAILTTTSLFAADPVKLTVRVDQPGVKISPQLYGLMTEEINHSYDGGIYAELLQNRIFRDDAARPAHWSLVGNANGNSIALDKDKPLNIDLNTSLQLKITNVAAGQKVGIANDGYWGIPVKPNTTYNASFYARAADGFAGPLTVAIESNAGVPAATATVEKVTGTWQKYTATLKTGAVAPSTANRFVISAASRGTVNFTLVSLMPPTYNNRPNGNRIDLMEKLADMKPAFLRLPGGNYLEGDNFMETFFWKETLGPLETRPGHRSPWNYRSSDGMGLLEFLTWCEDLKMDPVLAVFAGYTLKGDVVTGARLEPYVQDALDEIEYVTGDATTKWGAQRAKDGHPAPFKLTYVEIGNEDWFDNSRSYDYRYGVFHDAIKGKYPKLQLIATMPVSSRKPDVVDDHYYRSAVAMENDVHHYDQTDRNGPKIFVGEWATTEGSPTPTMNAALGDAAWMTGMERNSDLIVMSCYAPLLVNVNRGASQWGTNLIGYDALRSFGSPSYYAQRMFNQNRGDVVLPVELVSPRVATAQIPLPHGGVGVATWSTDVDYTDMKVTTPDGKALYQGDLKNTAGWKFYNGEWKAENGNLHQTSDANECRAITGDPTWGDYTYTLRARKNGGKEGFMAMFAVADSDNYIWWNVGGWGNMRTAMEIAEKGARRTFGNDTPLGVETGKWYDLRIDVRGGTYTCFLDGKQITTGT
ncbi:MAG TPA: alpha-L-arabinofuranosidase C-terminal domain-containing protein, partial [Phycisphaerae bacterium]|nr:alpha-L-arabinofuranosidase C-terminal domain-containing protein [Phycisphaerae bacterium]